MNHIDKMAKIYLGLLKNKDIQTYQHSIMVEQRAMAFAQYLQLSQPEQEIARYAGILHDIGKLFIPDTILKKPSTLTDEEFAIIKMYPLLGYQAFRQYFQNQNDDSIQLIGEAILHHHEYYDGNGYPDGIPIEKFSIVTSIVSLCDVYEALTAKRHYKPALSEEKALKIMNINREKQFHPELLDKFINYLEIEKKNIRYQQSV